MVIDRISILINLSIIENIEQLKKMRLNLKSDTPYINKNKKFIER